VFRTSLFSGSKSALAAAILCLVLVPSPYILHAADGDLDPTFGKNGTLTTNFLAGSNDVVFGLAVQPDGKVVAAGISAGMTVGFALARYNPDGSLDQTFGDGGRVLTSFRTWEMAVGVAVQRDGKIVAAGTSLSPDGITPSGFAVARYNRDGSLDQTFGDGGKVLTEFGDIFTEARAMTIQADGRIVVVGTAWSATGMTTDFAIARYLRNGAPDPSFGIDGQVLANVDDEDDARAVAVSFDGRITVAGMTRGPLEMNNDFAVVRLARDGSFDTTFGAGGILRTGQMAFASSVQVQRDGKTVVIGTAIDTTSPWWWIENLVIARYNRDGSLDPTFGKGGVVVSDSIAEASASALQADGKILVGSSSAASSFTVSRYNTDGSIDAAFGTGGVAQADFSRPDANIIANLTALAIQRDGRIVAGGTVMDFTNFPDGGHDEDFALARFQSFSASSGPR